jgi:hypothetical protein
MEIVEIISYFVNHSTDTIDVRFRFNNDEEDEIRVDVIDLKESDDFGYTLIVEDFDLFIDDEDEDDNNLLEDNVDEVELLSFLNEYYLIYPEKVPKKDLY